jgi:hypothetical protein
MGRCRQVFFLLLLLLLFFFWQAALLILAAHTSHANAQASVTEVRT